jgi:2-polyprenyl-3-methyl-5-hydroxy-6-metoxy-1,4-benzoquinol methylase
MSSDAEQRSLAAAMLDFSQRIPVSAGLEWVKEMDFLYYFEAERLLVMRQALQEAGFLPDSAFDVLDFGYLHGLVPEFLHRFFPRARFTVLDHPQSPNFRNQQYVELIRTRNYLMLEPLDIAAVHELAGTYDLIILGEIIEHLDPTVVAKAVAVLRQKISQRGRLIVTTPNGAGIKNLFLTLIGRDVQHPVVPDETMNYGHIHLWTPTLLDETMRHYGWENERTYFTHGFDRWDFHKTNRHWGSLRHQILIKSLYAAAQLRRRWRGFLVSTWKPALPMPGSCP